MNDTIDRLVRMLDEEKQKKEAARRQAKDERTRLMRVNMDNSRLERELEAAEKKIDEWRAYSGHLLTFIPKKKVDASVRTPPANYEREIPF